MARKGTLWENQPLANSAHWVACHATLFRRTVDFYDAFQASTTL
jgi:hypothetical protein